MNATDALSSLFRGFAPNITFMPLCSKWDGPQHIFLQLANVLQFLGLLFGSVPISTLIFMRSIFLVGNVVTLLWAWLVTCSSDIFLWSVTFALINAFHIIVLIIKLHPFISFPHEVEMAYRNLFLPLGVSRYNFRKLYRLTRGIHTIKAKDVYAVEDKTLVDSLSLVISGRLSVLKKGHTRHIIDCYQFIESPDWFGMSTSDKYQVSVVSLEECQFLVWNRDKLKLCISSDRYLLTILDHILAKDICKKLMLSLDMDCPNSHSVQQSEKTKLIQPKFHSDQILSLNTLHDRSQCFWSLSSSHSNGDNHQETSI